MANGTGATAGPFSVSSGSTATYNDPNARGGQNSDQVQIQNASNYLLEVLTSGPPYTVQPQQATTIPTPAGGQSITITAPAGQGIQPAGSISLIWLLPGQTPPIPDGLLTTGTPAEAVVLPPYSGTISNLVPFFSQSLPITAQAQSLTIQIAEIVGTFPSTYYVTLSVTGNSTGFVYLSENLGAVQNYTVTCPLFGAVETVTVQLGFQVAGTWSLNFYMTAIASTSPYQPTALTITPTPGSPLDIVEYGGLYSFPFTALTNGTTTQILSTPDAGTAYRLHSWALNQALTAGNVSLRGPSGGQFYATMTTPGSTQFLGGRLVTTAVSVVNNGTGATIAGELGYDLVTLPTIS